MAKERRKKGDQRKKKRRKLLSEKEFRELIKKGKVSKHDKRSWTERRTPKRRKRQMGI